MTTAKYRRISRGYGKIINSQLHPQLQLFQQAVSNSQQQSVPLIFQKIEKKIHQRHHSSLKQLTNHIPIVNHNGELASKVKSQRHYSVIEIEDHNRLLKNRTITRVNFCKLY